MVLENPLTPALRFPEFSGEWEEKPFTSLGEFRGGGTPDTSIEHYWSGNIPWISSSDIEEDNLHTIHTNRFITKIAVKESATKIIPSNSILLISRVGVGKLAVTLQELCTSQDFTNFTPKKDNVFFIAYWLLRHKVKLISLSQGTSIKGFTIKDINLLKLPLPTLPEQQKIASFLTAVDARIAHLQQKHTLLQTYKKGLMQQLFSQALRFTQPNGSPYPAWEDSVLGKHCNITTGALDANAMVINGIYPFFTCARDVYRINTPAFNTEALLISGNGANVGYIHYYNGQFNAYQRTYVLDAFKHNIQFVKHYLHQHLKKRIFSEVKEGNTPYIVMGTLSKMSISFPHPEEQQKIAACLSAVDAKISLTAQAIQHAQAFKKGLLQQLFV
ncbi:MAG: restriction endonuclease subunit S [Vampirovibrio sp.]|nr:restriction endonuclease subunit S [Vampirovibrio sp.]